MAHTPLAPGVAPARIAYRSLGRPAGGRRGRAPIVFLHGGWGYDMYPLDGAAFADRRILAPDRSGYGASPPIATLPPDFHQRAVEETEAVIDALGLDRPVLWGHSDGAIVALRLALARPARVSAIVAEATHYFRRKPHSRAFFDAVAANPQSTPTMRLHARAWLQIGDAAESAEADFYDGRLGAIAVPALAVHGARDPRTELGEIDALRVAAPSIRVVLLPEGGHSPHSEPATAAAVAAAVREFLDD